MINRKTIKVGKNNIQAFCIKLQDKNFILLQGKHGYIMCGYLNLKTAEKFADVAVKITGVSTIEEAIKAKVHSLTSAAGRLGIRKGQAVKEILPLIA